MRKTLGNYLTLPRIPLLSHLQALHYFPISAYTGPKAIAEWTVDIGKYLFRPKHPFMAYPTLALAQDITRYAGLPSQGVYPAFDDMTLCLAGDWATGTDEASLVAWQIGVTLKPEYTIHLGDVYYVGGETEVKENFLGIKSSSYDPVSWPRGSVRSFALLGNHDMYADGSGYFDVLLPALGQAASYFCLENDHWRIIGLDTGYNSAGIEIDDIVKPSCRLPAPVVNWLGDLELDKDDRGLIFLSHHGPWSAFETCYPEPAAQIAPFLNRPILWFWGHEHRLVVYERNSATYAGVKLPTAYGRCVGHGGMPVKLKKDNHQAPVLYSDFRKYPNKQGLSLGYNGFAILRFAGKRLDVDYADLNGTVVFAETWTPASIV